MKLSKNIPFTVAPNDLINDSSLSTVARFIYVFMASKPDDWEFWLKAMANSLNMNVKTLRKYMKELEQSGWLTNEGQINYNGQFGSNKYIIHATPCTKNMLTVREPIFTVRQNCRVDKIGAHTKERLEQKKDLRTKERGKHRSENENLNFIDHSNTVKEKNSAKKENVYMVQMKSIWLKRFDQYHWQNHDSDAAFGIYHALRLRLIKDPDFGFGVKVLPDQVVEEWERIVENLPGWIIEKHYAEVPFILKKINSITNEIRDKQKRNQPISEKIASGEKGSNISFADRYFKSMAHGS